MIFLQYYQYGKNYEKQQGRLYFLYETVKKKVKYGSEFSKTFVQMAFGFDFDFLEELAKSCQNKDKRAYFNFYDFFL